MNTRLLIYLTLSIAVSLVSCSGSSRKDHPQQSSETQGEHASHGNMDMGSNEPTGESIYNVNSTWRNRYGYEVSLDSLRGKIQVVAMVYTHCEYACPRILADMKRIRDSLTNDVLKHTNFVIISIDPERDTPRRLKEFATENNLDDEQWTLLNGGQGDVLEMAALLGVKYKRISDTDFTHSNIITVLNREGEVVHQRKKLSDQQTATVAEITRIASS